MPRGGRSSSRSSSPSGGGGGMFGRSRSSSPAPPPRRSAPPPPPPSRNVPAAAPPAAMGAPAPKQPGMMAQMAATAGAVAIGSTVAHVATAAIMGNGGSSNAPADQQQQGEAAQPAQPVDFQGRDQRNPCEYEMKTFMDCSMNQSDITLCQGFQESLKQCKLYYNPVQDAPTYQYQ